LNVSELVSMIDACRQHGNLSSATRLFVLDVICNQISALQVNRQRENDEVLSSNQMAISVGLDDGELSREDGRVRRNVAHRSVQTARRTWRKAVQKNFRA